MQDQSENRFEKHSKLVMAVIWITILVAGLAVMEWFLTPKNGRHFGTAGQSSPAARRYLVMREWERNTDYQMGAPKARFRDKSGEVDKVYQLSTDTNGFIEPAIRHREADLNIVFLGGSTTECLYVRPENRFPYVTAKILEDYSGLKINGLNSARSGNSTMHSLLLLLGKVVPLKPDFVVFMHATNDIGVLSSYGQYWTSDKNTRLVFENKRTIDSAVRALSNQLLPYTSRTLLRARKTLKNQFNNLFSSAQALQNDTQAKGEKDKWVRYGKSFESAVRSFVRVAKAWDIKPVLMTQVAVTEKNNEAVAGDYITPEKLARAGLDTERYKSLQGYFNGIIRHVAKTEDVILVDLVGARDWKLNRDLYDGLHYTDEGSKAVAQIISDALKDHITSKPDLQ